MPELFDPNAQLSQSVSLAGPNDSLDARRRQLEERRARLKAYMAKNMAQPEGQMVSGHFVAPHWAQYLPGLADKLQGGMEQRQIDEASLAQGVAEKAQLRDALTQLSGSPGEAATPFGSRDEPRQDAVQATPPPTGADRRAIIAKLMDNPAAGALGGELLKDDLISAPIRAEAIQQKNLDREDRQVEAQATLNANLTLRREQLAQQAEDAKRRSEDTRLGIEQRREAAQQHNALMAQLQADRLAAKANAGGGAGEKPAKPLTAKQLETQRGFMDLESSLNNYDQMLSGYDPRGGSAMDPTKRAALEGAYTDLQMKLKTLYELGAPQAGDLKLLSQSIPSPVDMTGTIRGAAFGSEPFKAKNAQIRKLLNNSRTNFETQMGRETPAAAGRTGGATGDFSGPTVVRTGRRADGTRVEQLSDGTVRNAK